MKIKVFAPATVANVACGFDIFGFALDCPGDELEVSLNHSKHVSITQITGDQGKLSLDPSKNTASWAAMQMLSHLKSEQGVAIALHKKMPLGSGLGSSAASAAGSLFALNALLGFPLTPLELVPFAMEGERLACGSAHADNVAPALLGGFTLIRSHSPLDIIQIPTPLEIHCTILHPHIEIRTEDARKMLRKEISLTQHVQQSGNAAALIYSLLKGDSQLMRRSLHDVIAEPVRRTLIPGFQDIKTAALEANALGCSLSGSGPALFALSLSRQGAEKIGVAMEKAGRAHGLSCEQYLSKINYIGPKLL